MQKKNGCGWLGLVGVAKDAKRSTRKHPQFAVNAESGESWYSYFDNARTFNPKPATKTPLSPKFCPKPRDTSAETRRYLKSNSSRFTYSIWGHLFWQILTQSSPLNYIVANQTLQMRCASDLAKGPRKRKQRTRVTSSWVGLNRDSSLEIAFRTVP